MSDSRPAWAVAELESSPAVALELNLSVSAEELATWEPHRVRVFLDAVARAVSARFADGRHAQGMSGEKSGDFPSIHGVRRPLTPPQRPTEAEGKPLTAADAP